MSEDLKSMRPSVISKAHRSAGCHMRTCHENIVSQEWVCRKVVEESVSVLHLGVSQLLFNAPRHAACIQGLTASAERTSRKQFSSRAQSTPESWDSKRAIRRRVHCKYVDFENGETAAMVDINIEDGDDSRVGHRLSHVGAELECGL